MSIIGSLGRATRGTRGRLQFRGFSERKESPLKGMLNDAASFDDAKTKSEWATHPYPYMPEPENEIAEKLDARESALMLFPGQGSQYMGMGRSLFKYPNVKALYECASEVVGFDISNIQNEKELEKYCQISVVVASLAAVERLRDERPSALPACVGAAGFSLGEITALIFAGAIQVEQGFQVVNIRSMAMEAASRENPGGMVTIMYGPEARLKDLFDDAKEHCFAKKVKNPVCSIANYLFPQCCVVSGSLEALNFIESKGKNYGVRKSKRVNVSGAFHTEYMEKAVEPVRSALSSCYLSEPKIPVYSAVHSKRYRGPESIMSILPKQIVQPVKWEQLMHFMYARKRGENFPRTFEIGPGNTLRSILRKVNAPAWDSSFSILAE